MFDDAPIRLPYNAGLERSFLAVLAVFGNQFGRFLGELHPSPAFGHGVAGRLCSFAYRRDGLHGFGFERLGIETLALKPQIYGTGVAEERDALLVLNDGDVLSGICIVVFGVADVVVSVIGGDELIGIVRHGVSLQFP